MGSCGLPLPGLTTRVVDPGTGLDCETGAEGELIVRGPNLMLGYHEKPAETAAAVKEGWYHTGDLARSDENGFLTITGKAQGTDHPQWPEHPAVRDRGNDRHPRCCPRLCRGRHGT